MKFLEDNIKVLELDVLPRETNNQLNDYTFSALSADKMASMLADNNNSTNGKFQRFQDFGEWGGFID